MASDNGGPWGGGGGNRPGSGGDGRDGRRPGNDGPQLPELDELVKKGQEQLRVLMGGRGNTGRRGGGSGNGQGPRIGRGGIALVALALVAAWLFASFYRVDTSEQGVELMFGKAYRVTNEGPHLAPWPVITREIYPVTRENTIDIGTGSDQGLMLTGDENIVDIDFQVVWNIGDVEKFVFNVADPVDTITAVSESAMREIIARSELAPILNRDRGAIAQELQELIQSTLDSYESGVNIVRVNFDRADPPQEVIDSFRQVQAAEQTRDTLQKQADAYSNQVIAAARGQAAQLLEEAEAYRAKAVNEAEGEAARFVAVYKEYSKAKEVTRKRLYLETMQQVLSGVNKIIIDDSVGGDSGVVPYLPLNELRPGGTPASTPASTPTSTLGSSTSNTSGGSN